MDIMYSKIISGCIIFVLTVVSGCGPYVLLRRFSHTGSRHRSKAAARINSTQAFACGIFIGTCLLHLLPEAAEDIQKSITSDLPICEMLVAFGFLLLLVTENLILAIHHRGGGDGNSVDREHSASVSVDETGVNDSSYRSNERRTLMDGSAAPAGPSYGSMNNAGDGQTGKNGFTTHIEGKNSLNDYNNPRNLLNDRQTEETQPYANQAGGAHESKPTSDRANTTMQEKETEMTEAGNKTAVLKSFVLLFALSLHTVFDGLVVGLQSDQTEVWTLLAAVGLHKVLIAVSIALSLLESHYNHPAASLLYLFLFSLVAPAGLAVGVILTETDFDTHAQTLASGVLQSVATGTFMYVTFVECLKGRFEGRDRLLNVFLVLVGFGLVCGLRVVLPG